MPASTPVAAGAVPLVIIDTNVVYDFFLGRDPDVLLLASLVPAKLAKQAATVAGGLAKQGD